MNSEETVPHSDNVSEKHLETANTLAFIICNYPRNDVRESSDFVLSQNQESDALPVPPLIKQEQMSDNDEYGYHDKKVHQSTHLTAVMPLLRTKSDQHTTGQPETSCTKTEIPVNRQVTNFEVYNCPKLMVPNLVDVKCEDLKEIKTHNVMAEQKRDCVQLKVNCEDSTKSTVLVDFSGDSKDTLCYSDEYEDHTTSESCVIELKPNVKCVNHTCAGNLIDHDMPGLDAAKEEIHCDQDESLQVRSQPGRPLRSCKQNSLNYACDSDEISSSEFSADDSDFSDSEIESLTKQELVCQVQGCRRMFDTHRDLNKHHKICRKARPVTKCNDLGKESVGGIMDEEVTAVESDAVTEVDLPKCPKCGRTFPTKNRLHLHFITHTEGFQYACPMENCDETFLNETLLRKHKSRHDTKDLKCPEIGCDKSYAKKVLLQRHLRYHKMRACRSDAVVGGKQWECEICKKAFGAKQLYSQHMLVHSDRRPFVCSKQGCNRAFKCAGDQRRHLMSHSNLRPFVCPVRECGKNFKNAGELKKHGVRHQVEKRFQCEFCGSRHKSRELVRKHRDHHHADITNKIIVKRSVACTYPGCGKTFACQAKLDDHLKRHGSDRPYQCVMDEKCKRTFKVHSDMVHHAKRMHNVKV